MQIFFIYLKKLKQKLKWVDNEKPKKLNKNKIAKDIKKRALQYITVIEIFITTNRANVQNVSNKYLPNSFSAF